MRTRRLTAFLLIWGLFLNFFKFTSVFVGAILFVYIFELLIQLKNHVLNFGMITCCLNYRSFGLSFMLFASVAILIGLICGLGHVKVVLSILLIRKLLLVCWITGELGAIIILKSYTRVFEKALLIDLVWMMEGHQLLVTFICFFEVSAERTLLQPMSTYLIGLLCHFIVLNNNYLTFSWLLLDSMRTSLALIANDFCFGKQVCLMMILGIFLGIFSKAEIIFSHSLLFDFRLLFERGIWWHRFLK